MNPNNDINEKSILSDEKRFPVPSDPHIYLCIDLKSFFASVEAVERGLDPMTTNLVVADPDRSRGTICLAITPAMKRLGIKNRCRLYEIPTDVEYIIAPPRMQKYIDYAADIYSIYLKYIAKEDIYVYSIDEAFIDVTDYLHLYNTTPKKLGRRIMADILAATGIRATCGIGTNLYLAKIALDITAKHSRDFIGELDEDTYCRTLWDYGPLTDFWRIGPGTARRLAEYGIHTIGQIAHADEGFLYRLFGIDAELLIDHAWGREPVTIKDIKAYKSKTNSLSSGQVFMRDYKYDEGRLIVKEMMDLLCLDMTDKKLVTRSVSLCVGYSHARHQPPSNGTTSLNSETNSSAVLVPKVAKLYDEIVNPYVPIRRINITCNSVVPEEYHQYDLFADYETREKEQKAQKAVLEIKSKYGKNAILKGMDFEEGAMTRERNRQIGGHKSGSET